MSKLFNQDVQKVLENMENIRDEITNDYFQKLESIGERNQLNRSFLKDFFSTTNNYRNLMNKECNKAEEFLHSKFRESPSFKNKELKKIVNIDYAQGKKYFSDQDGYLKKRVSDILNAKKN